MRLASLRTHATCNMQRSKLLPELKERAERAERTALIIFHLEINNPSWTWELGSREYLSWRLIQFWTLAFFSVFFCLFLSFSVFFCLFHTHGAHFKFQITQYVPCGTYVPPKRLILSHFESFISTTRGVVRVAIGFLCFIALPQRLNGPPVG